MSSMFLYTAYSANVVALLQSTTNSIKTVEDLINTPMQYGAMNVVYNHHIFKNEDRPVHQALWLKKGLPQGDKFFTSVEEGIRRVREGFYAFHVEVTTGTDEIQRTFLEAEKCQLSRITYVSFPSPHFSLSKNTPLREQLRVGIFRMKENGVHQRSHNRVIHYLAKCDSGGAVFSPVSVADVVPAFKYLAIMYAVAITVFGLEVVVDRRVKERKSRIIAHPRNSNC